MRRPISSDACADDLTIVINVNRINQVRPSSEIYHSRGKINDLRIGIPKNCTCNICRYTALAYNLAQIIQPVRRAAVEIKRQHTQVVHPTTFMPQKRMLPV